MICYIPCLTTVNRDVEPDGELSFIMKVMILAAGRGERMRPLTDSTPKPLLEVKGKSLIQYHIEAVAKAGFDEIVINHAWLGEKIEAQLGNGRQFGVSIEYSREGKALETGGGIFHALPLLGNAPFIVINGDIFTDYNFDGLLDKLSGDLLLHLVMVPNPEHNPKGDFALERDRVLAEGEPRYTFSGIAAYQPEVFAHCQPGSFPLAPLLRKAMATNQAGGEIFQGLWTDVGTPERLAKLNI